MNKEDYTHTHNGVLFSHEKEGKPVTQMDLEAKCKKTDRKRRAPHGITYKWNLKQFNS